MDLFNPSKNQNLLPKDGTVIYYGSILQQAEAEAFYNALLKTVAWKNDEAIIFGKRIITKRKVAWYGDQEFDYTYSKTTKKALLWTPELMVLKEKVEDITETTFNSCLLNLYHDGSEGMAYHSDDEKSLTKNGSIASLSLGGERKFLFKHKTSKELVSIFLEHGSLLVMKDQTQSHWLHRLPPTKLKVRPRVNLTFRNIV